MFRIIWMSLFPIGITLRNRYQVEAIIGRGGYGQIFQAFDKFSNMLVAIKAESLYRKGRRARRMILEQQILLKLQGNPHAPIMLQSGMEKNANFIVMQLLSKNVGQFRKESPLRRLSKSTCGRLMQQAVAAIRDLHELGFLHRDLKPANVCFGLTCSSRHRLFIIDYGLARRFKNNDGSLRPQRQRIGFRGTSRYVSLRAHRQEEAGPADDLISLFYTFIELLRGELSWRRLRKFSDIKAAKEKVYNDSFKAFAVPISDSISEFGQNIAALSSIDEPNYTALQAMLNDLVGVQTLSDPYDWENNYIDVLKETEINIALGLVPTEELTDLIINHNTV